MSGIKELIEFTIPSLPPSYTANLRINYGTKQTYLSQKARRFKDMVKITMPSHKLKLKDTDKLIIHNQYHYDWYFKNGSIRKKDVQNLDRLLIDSVFSGLGIDDRNLFCVINEKIQDKEKEQIVVKLYLANEVEDYLNKG